MLLLGFWKHPTASLLAVCCIFWNFHFKLKWFPLKGRLNLLKKIRKVKSNAEEDNIEGWDLFRTSSNPADSEPAVTSGDNWGSSAAAPNLQTAHRTTSCPPLPRELTTVRARTRDGVPRTDPAYYWKCCYEEIVRAQHTLGFPMLNRLFAARLASANVAPTAGHDNWFRNNNHLLLQLFAAANLQIAPSSAYAKTLSVYWNLSGKTVTRKI